MNKFNISFSVLVKLLIGKLSLIKPKRLAWLHALIAPAKQLYDQLSRFRSETLYDLSRTSQVVHIEGVLNDRWDTALRRIKVLDGQYYDPLPIYKQAEAKPLHIYKQSENKPQWLYKDQETSQTGVDFIVEIPVLILFDVAEMTAILNKYRLPGKVYIIKQV